MRVRRQTAEDAVCTQHQTVRQNDNLTGRLARLARRAPRLTDVVRRSVTIEERSCQNLQAWARIRQADGDVPLACIARRRASVEQDSRGGRLRAVRPSRSARACDRPWRLVM